MKRKLLLLNLTMALVVVYAGWQLRREWVAAKAREAETLGKKLKPAPPPPFTPLQPAPPVVAAGYADIVQKTLFDRSRNPTVVVEAPPPPPAKPMPPLPAYHGMMNVGDGITAVMSVAPGAPHQGIHIGEPIGQFKLVDVNTEEIALEWDGQTIRKKLDELVDNSPAAQQAGAAPARTEVPAPAAVAAAAPAVPVEAGPGGDAGAGFRACVPNDTTPSGAVKDGYRKNVVQTPFGPSCRWEPVKR